MDFFPALKRIFASFVRFGLKTNRTRLFWIISLIPMVLLGIIKIIEVAKPASGISTADFYSNTVLVFYFQLLIPVLALFYGSSIITDEVDNKTLVYLTTCPVPKSSILLGKYLACIVLMAMIISSSFFISFLIATSKTLNSPDAWAGFFRIAGVSLVALLSYSAIFTFLGTLMRRSILIGLLFVFGWESIVQYFPGSTQKFTLIHYVKSLLPFQAEQTKFLVFHLEPSGAAESLVTLLLVAAVFLTVTTVVFQKKEYVIGDSN